MNARQVSSRVLTIVGGIAMLVGAIDPLEGALLILPGSGLFALGTYLGQAKRRLVAYRVWVFVLIAIGVAALRITPGDSWWAILALPYPIGWWMGICGPGSPRWMLWLGIVVGLWYLGLLTLALRLGRYIPANIFIATVGLLTIGGCVYRLRKRDAE